MCLIAGILTKSRRWLRKYAQFERWLVVMADVTETGIHSEFLMRALSRYTKWLKADRTIKQRYYYVHVSSLYQHNP